MDIQSIGKLEKVDIRSAWKTEPEFTQWLEQNPELLSDALGIPVESLTREQSAGDFFVDLVGEDGAGAKLIVENQFGKSDHDHLGKILTYLAAFEAVTAVWVVETARPEHIKAFAWLNDSSNAAFYLVQMQALRIADSPPAPLLTLIVGPAAERGKISEIKKDMAESDRLRLQFWSELINRSKAKNALLFAHLKPSASSWIAVGAGISGLSYNYVLGNDNARVELYIDQGGAEASNRKVFEQLRTSQEAIEQEFGHPLDWQPLEGKRAKRIAWKTTTGGLKTSDAWPALQEELIDAMDRFAKALKPRIAALKL